jgi:hypothetical protein
MTDQWDRFASGAERTIDALGYQSNVAVFEPAETFTQGEGYEISYPGTPTALLDGMIEPPSAQSDFGRGGGTREADLSVFVDADVSVDFTDAGESEEALTRIEVDEVAGQFEVEITEPQLDGLLRLDCSEVDRR